MIVNICKREIIMKTIQLQIDDNNYDSFMTILKNLKKGFIKGLKVDSDSTDVEFVSDKEQQHYEKLLNNLSAYDKIISSTESIQI